MSRRRRTPAHERGVSRSEVPGEHPSEREPVVTNARIIGAAEIQDRVGDNADLFVGINQRKSSLSEGSVGQIFVSTLRRILYRIGEELELVNQMRKKRLINLRKLKFPLRQMPKQFVHNGWSYRGRPAIDEINYFRHGADCSEKLVNGKEKLKSAEIERLRVGAGSLEVSRGV